MKKPHIPARPTLVAAGLLLAALSFPSRADDPGKSGVAIPAGPAPANPAATSGPQADAWAAMSGKMKVMQEQMAKIHATTDPKLRADLLNQHLKTMQETMELMMGGNGGCPMGGGAMPMMNGGAMPLQGAMMGGGMGRGNMMQLMMEQMAQHQEAWKGPAK